jgi:predicted PurR-regulated permease PerM
MTIHASEAASVDPSSVQLPASPVEGANKNLAEGRALRVCALFAAAIILWITHPVGIGVLLGTLTAFTMLPLYVRLRNRWQRPALAALFCVLLTTLGAAAAFAGFTYLLIGRGIVLVRNLVVILQPGGSLRVFFESQNALLPQLGVHPGTIAERVGDAAAGISSRLASVAHAVAGTMGTGVLQIFFLIITMFFVLLQWSSLIQRAAIMLPLEPRDTRALFEEFRRVGRSVLLGTVLTGMAQGLLAGIGFYLTKVPEAAFFGALTAVASLLPGAGTLLVWVPAGIYLLATGHVALGLVELLYGALVVVGFSDYVLRPRLVGGNGNGPALFTFIALFGAVEVFGLIGLLLGPVLMTLALAVLRIYEREATLRRADEVAAALAALQSGLDDRAAVDGNRRLGQQPALD